MLRLGIGRHLRCLLCAWLIYVCSSSIVFAAKVSYIGNYVYQGKPALIIQFDHTITERHAADLYKIEQKDGKKNETLLESASWALSPAKNALIFSDVEMDRSYKIKLRDGIEQQKNVSRSQTVTIYQREPAVKLLGRGPVVPANGSRTLPLSVVNTSQLSVEVMSVDKPQAFLKRNYYDKAADTWDLQRLRKNYQAVTSLSFDVPKSPINSDYLTAIQLPKSLKDGWYLLVIKVAGDFNSSHYVVAQVLLSDIGVQAKVFPSQLALSLNRFSGQSLSLPAQVSVVSEQDDHTQTIKLGEMRSAQQTFDYQVKKGDLLIVNAGEQMSVLPLKEVPLDLSDFDVAGRDWAAVEAFSYSNRDLFKPGESVPLNIVLRSDDGEPVSSQRLYLQYRKPNGDVIGGRWLEPSEAEGFYQDRFTLPNSAPLGQWRVDILSHKQAKQPLGQFSFNVSEFVPERMDMQVTMAKGLQNKVESLPVKLSGRYLFGAPAAGNALTVSSYYQPQQHFPGPYQAFYVGKPFKLRSWQDVPSLDTMTLDDNGQLAFDFPLVKQALIQSPLLAKFHFSLYETGGASIQRSHTLQLWTGKSIPAILPAQKEFDYYSDAEFKVGILNAQGDKLLGGELTYVLERNRGDYYWVYSEESGWDLKRDIGWAPESSDVLHVKAGETVPLSLKVRWGEYRLIVQDSHHNQTIYRFDAGWSNDSEKQRPVKPDQLAMTLDKPSYQDGDTVVATINSEVAGELMLSLETNQVEWHLETKIDKGSHKFNLPLDGLKRHDVYLTATLIDSHAEMPRRLFTIKPVKLDREPRRLAVTIEHDDKLLPLKPATIKVSLANPPTTPTWVTLSLVDRGIINLSRYKVPSIYNWFFAQRRYAGDVIDLYSRLYQQRPDSFLTHRYGGDSDIGANSALGQTVESKTVTLMSKPVQFNAEGEAFIDVDIPDYNGEAQVVAMAFNGSQFGQAQSNVKIAAPIVAELAVPRFLAPNDTSQTLLELFNATQEPQTVIATVSANEMLTFGQKTEFSAKLAANQRVAFTLPYQVNPLSSITSVAKINIDIKAQGANGEQTFSQQRSWNIPVRSAVPVVSKKTAMTLSAYDSSLFASGFKTTIDAPFWAGIDKANLTNMRIGYSTTPQISYLNYIDYLFRYPYGCAEQTTSTAMPWLLEDDSLTPLKQKQLDEDDSAEQRLRSAVLRLMTMQKANGSFSLWNKHGRENPWISVYVSDFLFKTAQRYPDVVPDSMLENALQNLTRYGGRNDLIDTKYYAAWVLQQANKLDYNQLWTLSRTNTSKQLSPVSSAYLGGAFLLQGQQSEGERFFNQVEALDAQKYPYHYGDYSYSSFVSDYAKTIVVLSQVEKVIKLSDDMLALRNRLVEKVIKRAAERRYLSTREQTALVEAGLALKAGNRDFAELTLVHRRKPKDYQAHGLGMIDAAAGDTIINKTAKPIYVQVTTSGLAIEDQIRSTLKASNAERKYFKANGSAYHGEPLSMGDKLVVSVTYRLTQRVPDALVVEYIPTGFVLEDPQFTDSGDLIRSAKVKSASSTHMQEYRNDRFVASLDMKSGYTYTFNYVIRAETAGTASVPALYVESMYQPENLLYQPMTAFKSMTIKPLELAK